MRPDVALAAVVLAVAVPVTGLDVEHCLRALDGVERRDPRRCPDYLIEPLGSARRLCLDAGGRPEAAPEPEGETDTAVRSLDVRADGDPEFLFDASALVRCADAWSALSCGSLGCPETLVERRSDGAWRTIARLEAGAGRTLERLGSGVDGYRDLAGGCEPGADPCVERTVRRWNGEEYAVRRIEVRGFAVDPDGAQRGLRTLRVDAQLRATPRPDGEPLMQVAAGTDVAVLGRALDGSDLFVSPCNACPRGFVAEAALRP